jgi:transposase
VKRDTGQRYEQTKRNRIQKARLIKIAIDMHLSNYRVVRQLDHSRPQPAARLTPEEFYLWLEKQRGLGERVVVSYEAGCFGYEPARRMQRMGVEVCVIAPQNWDEQGKRQVNDKHDALVMCRRLSEYLCGHRKALSVVRIPSREEEARRAAGRMREQLGRELRGAGHGAQPFAAKGAGRERALVGGLYLAKDSQGDAALGHRSTGELEEAHRAH